MFSWLFNRKKKKAAAVISSEDAFEDPFFQVNTRSRSLDRRPSDREPAKVYPLSTRDPRFSNPPPFIPSPARQSDDENVGLSMAVGSATHNGLLGALVGGSFVGGMAGAAIAESSERTRERERNDSPASMPDFSSSSDSSSCDNSSSSDYSSSDSGSCDSGGSSGGDW